MPIFNPSSSFILSNKYKIIERILTLDHTEKKLFLEILTKKFIIPENNDGHTMCSVKSHDKTPTNYIIRFRQYKCNKIIVPGKFPIENNKKEKIIK